jgi:hypothetical protein
MDALVAALQERASHFTKVAENMELDIYDFRSKIRNIKIFTDANIQVTI